MKRVVLVVLAGFLICSTMLGQIPKLISHQGYVADSTGAGITATLPMAFRLYTDSTAGSMIFTQGFPGVGLENGIFNVNLNIAGISFRAPYWLETEVNGEILSPRTRLTSAPYALVAESSLTSWSLRGNAGTVANTDFLGTTDNAPLSFRVNNTKAGRIDSSNTVLGYQADLSSGALTNATAVGAHATVGASNSLVLGNNANVGIGTSTPNEQLEITGNLRIPQTTGSTGIIKSGANRYIHNFGSDNFFAGVNAGNMTMTGVAVTGVGAKTLSVNTSGSSNTAIGSSALTSNTSGSANTAIGRDALSANTSGVANTATGHSALGSNTDGNYNAAFGREALLHSTEGNSNTAVGDRALNLNTIGSDNTAVGNAALAFNTQGGKNTALGVAALDRNNNGGLNTACGSYSLYNNDGSSNVGCGDSTLYSCTTGFLNTAIGASAGTSVTTGWNLTLVGWGAQPTVGNAVGQITLGNSSVTSLRCNVTTITSLSDARDKKNIQDLSLGLEFISRLKPRQFNWDKREWYTGNVSDGSKMQGKPTAGFIAQELDEAQTSSDAEWLNLVLKDNPEKLEATWGNLLPVMVKAIQELREENILLKSENAGMKSRLSKIDELETLVKSLVAEVSRGDSKKLIGEVK